MGSKKRCFRCGLLKNTNKFRKRANGVNNNICINCKRIYNREYEKKRPVCAKKIKEKKQKIRKEKIKKWLYNYLLKNPCVDCGERDPVVLTFDHLKDKEMVISNMVGSGYSIERIKKEIEKCEVVCANCHLRRTSENFNWYKNKKKFG